MSDTKDVPAFPVTQQHDYCGMTLRDYFAAHAPPCPNWFGEQNGNGESGRIATWNYHFADAMLKARKEGRP